MNCTTALVVFAVLFSFTTAYAGPTKDSYRKAINNHAKELAICLNVKNGKSAKGKKIILEWQVDDVGTVRDCKIKKSATNNIDVDNCVVEKVKSLSFPPAPSGQIINIVYPIYLE